MSALVGGLKAITEIEIADERRNTEAVAMRQIARDALRTEELTPTQAKAHPRDGFDNIDRDRVAAALRMRLQGGKQLLPWDVISVASKRKWRDLADFTLNQYRIAKADRETIFLEKVA